MSNSINKEQPSFPLCWPEHRARTAPAFRRHAKFKTSFARARDSLIAELKRLGASKLIFSTNIPRRQDGQPYADAKPKNGDPGIAAYFTWKGKRMCFACDCYLTADDNMHAITLTIEALRGIARWSTGDMMEAAFRGFTAIPERTGGLAWWDVLGVAVNASPEQATGAYLAKAKKYHPDAGGSHEDMIELNRAWDEARRQLGIS